jgi:hypothetical protein
MDIPAFSGMLVNDEIGTAILNYKYNNNLLTDTNTVYILTNDNAVMPTGDPGIKPVELLSWAKDFKTSSIPFRIPGFSSKGSEQDHPSLRFSANNPVNCINASFDNLANIIQPYIRDKINYYANYFFDKVKNYYGGNKQAFIDNIYAVILRESTGRPLAKHKNTNGTIDCGLGQINVNYIRGYINDFYGLKLDQSIYNQFSNDINKLLSTNISSASKCDILRYNVDLNIALTYSVLVNKIQRAGLQTGNLNYVGNISQFTGQAHCIFLKLQEKYSNIDIYRVNSNNNKSNNKG